MAKAYPSDDEVDLDESRKRVTPKHHLHGESRSPQLVTQQDRRQHIGHSVSAELNRHCRQTYNHDQSAEACGEIRTKRMSYKRLIELSKSHDDPDDLLIELTEGTSGFEEIFDDAIKPDWLHYILRVLSDVIKSSMKRNLTEFLIRIEEKFFARLSEVLGEVSIKSKLYSDVWRDETSLVKACLLILKISQALAQSIRSVIGKCNHVFLIVKEIQSCLIVENEEFSMEIHNTEDMISAIVSEFDSTCMQPESEASMTPDCHETRPQDNFREVSISPTLHEIQSDEAPFLRPIKPTGNYDDLDSYLDIQFRLLREDFVYPLRKGISEYVESLYDFEGKGKIREIKVYENVQIIGPVCANDGLNHRIQFDTSKMKRVDWSSFQRLLYGSLLCFSYDNFRSVYYATVTERKLPQLRRGIIQVHFQTMPRTSGSTKFLMAESTAYFEAFRHVLQGLQLVEPSLPFQEYIIDCSTVIKPPSYLLGKGVPAYDFTCILPKKSQNECFTAVPALNTARWPTPKDLGLDKSQYEALQLALTKELAIIQGPPGTGKTYIGLQIAKMLLENAKYWKGVSKGSPILVVCYTNHALDQFLEGILCFCNGSIVRVGGRCKSQDLEPYTLHSLKGSRIEDKSKSEKREFYFSKKYARIAKFSCEQSVRRIGLQLEQTFTELQPYRTLYDQMTAQQRKSFETSSTMNKSDLITEWLSLKPSAMLQNDGIFDNEAAMRLWVAYILQRADSMTEKVGSLVRDVFSIALHERAKLYKKWLTEFKGQAKMRQGHTDSKSRIGYLLDLSRTNIILPKDMLPFIRSKNAKRQITMLTKPTDFQIWLALDLSDNSTDAIASVYTEIISEEDSTDDIDEVTEERELQDDVDSVLFDEVLVDTTQRKFRSWIRNWHMKNEQEKVKAITKGARVLSQEKADNMTNMWSISNVDRRSLYWHWVIKYREQLKNEVKESEQTYRLKSEALTELREKETKEILQSKHVIGMTTTGAAKNRKLLQLIKPAIVIVEEAAEVLESHIVTALNAECKHLILIGDHKQLRPSTTVYHLAKQYHLDISLFERMIMNEVPCKTLSEQHRMRPEISELLKNDFLYPNLKDHNSVSKYEHIHGIDSDVFFIEHSKPELRIPDSTSYRNQHEAKFVARLCRYLMKQGYGAHQITVLTPYMGQVSLLRKELRGPEYDGVHVTAVDNFQGEENDIILLSLVRSNITTKKKNPIGFLAISNRICVALSRAKKGMYVIGNFSLLKEHGKLWNHNVSLLEKSGRIGSELTLRCRNHPQTVIKASKPEDFDGAPEGGCMESCNTVLECNHVCPKLCHPFNSDHKIPECKEPCETVFPECGHTCKKQCYENCEKCETKVKRTFPFCGHMEYMPCHLDVSTLSCSKRCEVQLPCGHTCGRKCSECAEENGHEYLCEKIVSRQLQCKHTVQLQCYQDPQFVDCIETCSFTLQCGHNCIRPCKECKKIKAHIDTCKKSVVKELQCGHMKQMQCCQNPLYTACTVTWHVTLHCGHMVKMKCSEDPHTVICSKPCSAQLACGHKCAGTCSSCLRGIIHQQCESVCDRTLPCGHKCSYRCSDRCPPCNSPCEWTCSHGIRCKKKCSERCDPCLKDCSYRCEHSKCTKLCYEICDRKQCNEKCKKRLSCGHPCVGLCGEMCICSKFCYVQIRKIPRKVKNESCYIKVQSCKCIFPRTVLDEYMKQSTYAAGESVKRCPACRRLLSTNNQRYSNAIKLDWEDVYREFQFLRGSERNLRSRCDILHDRLHTLKKAGLHESDVNVLHERIDSCSVDALPAVEKSVELLEELLRVCPGLETTLRITLVIKPVEIKDLIMRDRKLGTHQVWWELRREINRIDYLLQLSNIQAQIPSDTEEVVTKTIAMLKEDKPFTEKMKNMAEQVIVNNKCKSQVGNAKPKTKTHYKCTDKSKRQTIRHRDRETKRDNHQKLTNTSIRETRNVGDIKTHDKH